MNKRRHNPRFSQRFNDMLGNQSAHICYADDDGQSAPPAGGQQAPVIPPAQTTVVPPAGTPPVTPPTGDNTGQPGEIPADFWSAGEGSVPAVPPQTVTTPAIQPAQGDPAAPSSPTASLDQVLQGVQFGPEALTAEAYEQLQQGDLTGFNANMQAAQTDTMRQTLLLVGQIMQNFRGGFEQDIQQMIESRITDENRTQYFDAEMPDVPEAVKPIYTSLFAQSLKNTKGDKKAALQMTKTMLAQLGVAIGNPRDPAQQQSPAPRQIQDWGAELGITAKK